MRAASYARKTSATGVVDEQKLARRALALVCSVIVSFGCEGSDQVLPTLPTDLSAGIVIYEHANYLGQSGFFAGDLEDLADYRGPCTETIGNLPSGVDREAPIWDDCISSIRVAPGWRAILYRDVGFKDDQMEVTTDIPDLALVQGRCDSGGFNECVSSIRVSRP